MRENRCTVFDETTEVQGYDSELAANLSIKPKTGLQV